MQIPRTMNTIGYAIFIALAAFSAFSHHEYMTAGSQLGIGLIFDPFAPAAWPERKIWQKGWMIVHVTLTFGLLIYGWFLE
jgi:hypothetical protein